MLAMQGELKHGAMGAAQQAASFNRIHGPAQRGAAECDKNVTLARESLMPYNTAGGDNDYQPPPLDPVRPRWPGPVTTSQLASLLYGGERTIGKARWPVQELSIEADPTLARLN